MPGHYSSTHRNFAMCAVFVLLLAGCAASPQTSYYLLTPMEQAQSMHREEKSGLLTIAISSLKLPSYLDRQQIVTLNSKNNIELAELHQWGGNLNENMARVLIKNLAALLDTPAISMPPYQQPLQADFRIELEVLQFEQGADGIVRLSVRWSVLDGKKKTLLVSHISELSSDPIGEHNYEQTVQTMSSLMAELSRILARQIIQLIGQRHADV